MTEPGYEFYTVTIERSDGSGLWDMVHREDHAYGHSAIDCADSVLRHRWPADVYDTTTPPAVRAQRRHEFLATGGAGVRVVVTPVQYNRRGDGGTFTLTEILLARIAREAAANAVRQAALREAREALKAVRNAAWSTAYDLKRSVGEAETAGVPAADIAKARRVPRGKPAAERARRSR